MNTSHALPYAHESGYRYRSGILVPSHFEPSDPDDDESESAPRPNAEKTSVPTDTGITDPIGERLYEKRDRRFERISLRPTRVDDVIGQDEALGRIEAILSSSAPTHMLLVGPAGVGKTTVARLALDIAKSSGASAFAEDAPFIVVDGATLTRDGYNKISGISTQVTEGIYGSVRDANRARGLHLDTPDIRFGPLAQAHMGILFIDEIGELCFAEQTALLTVLEEGIERVSPRLRNGEWIDDPRTPVWMSDFVRNGVPASVILIGATTRQPNEIDAALRSRCEIVTFRQLNEDDRRGIVMRAALKLEVAISDEIAATIAASTSTGRDAARRVQLAANSAKRRGAREIDLDDLIARDRAQKIGFRR